jgi:hypothetical protein
MSPFLEVSFSAGASELHLCLPHTLQGGCLVFLSISAFADSVYSSGAEHSNCI